jgi:uncharacterized membrane protein
MLAAAFAFLLFSPNLIRIFLFCIVLTFFGITLCLFRNYRWAWAICIGTAICVFVFPGLPVLMALLPTKANLEAHAESPGGTIILVINSLLFIVSPAILICYYIIHRKQLLELFMRGKP